MISWHLLIVEQSSLKSTDGQDKYWKYYISYIYTDSHSTRNIVICKE